MSRAFDRRPHIQQSSGCVVSRKEPWSVERWDLSSIATRQASPPVKRRHPSKRVGFSQKGSGSANRIAMDLEHFIQRAHSITLEIEGDISKSERFDRTNDAVGHLFIERAWQFGGIDLDTC
jgi:hypothetical protein